jgi:hypothetical protein
VRRLLQSAWLAPRVYGPHGAAFRRLLAASPGARAAGAKWYEGARLGVRTKARLAGGLAWAFVRDRLAAQTSGSGRLGDGIVNGGPSS